MLGWLCNVYMGLEEWDMGMQEEEMVPCAQRNLGDFHVSSFLSRASHLKSVLPLGTYIIEEQLLYKEVLFAKENSISLA